jgi:hypothetical protein
MMQRVRAGLAVTRFRFIFSFSRAARMGGVALAGVGALGASFLSCSLEVGGLAGAPASASGSGLPTGSSATSSGSGAGGGATASSSGSGSSSASGGGGSGGGGVVEGTTCLAIRDQSATEKPSRVYRLDPDGEDSGEPFDAYCEMVEDEGGWTLALKIDGEASTFEYNEALWEDNSTYRPEFPDLDDKEAKLRSFSTIGFKEVRLGMEENGTKRWIKASVPGFASSLEKVFSASFDVPTSIPEAEWRKLVETPSLQPHCKRQGFNIDTTDSKRARVRIGIVGNDQLDCVSTDSLLGFGADKDHGGPSGNFSRQGGDNGDKTTKTFGYVLVR